jgi:NADP-dependent 3-hydroxy acid dehydrogenase YdfG
VLGRRRPDLPQDRRKVLAAAEAIGGINLLINAAGVNHFAMLEQLDDSDINAMLALNISAPICLTKLLLPLLKQANSAMVVNVGSTYGSIGYPATPATAPPSSPCAVFRALRRELADTRQRAVCRAPRHPHVMNSAAAQA